MIVINFISIVGCRYVDLICSLLKPQGRILLSNLFYDQSERKG